MRSELATPQACFHVRDVKRILFHTGLRTAYTSTRLSVVETPLLEWVNQYAVGTYTTPDSAVAYRSLLQGWKISRYFRKIFIVAEKAGAQKSVVKLLLFVA